MDAPKINSMLVDKLLTLKDELAAVEEEISTAALKELDLVIGEIVMHAGLQYKVNKVFINTHNSRLHVNIECHRWWHTRQRRARSSTWFAPYSIEKIK